MYYNSWVLNHCNWKNVFVNNHSINHTKLVFAGMTCNTILYICLASKISNQMPIKQRTHKINNWSQLLKCWMGKWPSQKSNDNRLIFFINLWQPLFYVCPTQANGRHPTKVAIWRFLPFSAQFGMHAYSKYVLALSQHHLPTIWRINCNGPR